jgi:hypothetical protein
MSSQSHREVEGTEIPPRAERRSTRRRRVLFSGVLCSLDGTRCHDCTIRDMTELGAHVVVLNSRSLDAKVFLLHLRDGIAYEAFVVSKLRDSVSLKFGAAIPLARNEDSKVRWLKDLWRARRGY